jgi:hypothetical protein
MRRDGANGVLTLDGGATTALDMPASAWCDAGRRVAMGRRADRMARPLGQTYRPR